VLGLGWVGASSIEEKKLAYFGSLGNGFSFTVAVTIMMSPRHRPSRDCLTRTNRAARRELAGLLAQVIALHQWARLGRCRPAASRRSPPTLVDDGKGT